MKQNILTIPVTADIQEEPLQKDGGVMFEHNATALCFQIAPEFRAETYQFYLEFVTVDGVMRTEYLVPDAQNEILFSIPQEVTQKMTALAILNIEEKGINGIPNQCIKQHRVRLYFSNLENTEKKIDANYAFSVNQLLEAIEKGTFRGAKGEKGDTGARGKDYILSTADKQEIADLMNKDHFGLPLYTRTYGSRKIVLSNTTNIADIRSLSITPNKMENPIKQAMITIGENILDSILNPEGYKRFAKGFNNFDRYTFYLKPNTEYTFSHLRPDLHRSNCFLAINGRTYYVSSTEEASKFKQEQHFTTVDKNESYFTYQYLLKNGPEYYQTILDKEWDGLALFETATTTYWFQDFKAPLYYLNDTYKDTFDFLTGKAIRRVKELTFPAETLIDEAFQEYHYSGGVLYAYEIFFPDDAPMKMDEYDLGYVQGLPKLQCFFEDDAALQTAFDNGENIEGVCMDTYYQSIIILSKKTMPELKKQLADLDATGQSLLVAYPSSTYKEQVSTPKTFLNASNCQKIYTAPYFADATITYSTNISEKTIELEERIKALENRL